MSSPKSAPTSPPATREEAEQQPGLLPAHVQPVHVPVARAAGTLGGIPSATSGTHLGSQPTLQQSGRHGPAHCPALPRRGPGLHSSTDRVSGLPRHTHTPGHLSSHLRALGESPMTAHLVTAPSLLVLFLWCPQTGPGAHCIRRSPGPPLGCGAHLPLHRPRRHSLPSVQPAPMRPHTSGHLCPPLAVLKLLPQPLQCHRPPRSPSAHDRASQPLTHGHSGAR